MIEQSLTDPGAEPDLGESRTRVLDVLRAAEGAATVRHVADNSGLHPNTARFHLDGLVDAGYVERATEARSHPGRPRMVYRAVPREVVPGRRSYRLLTEMLTSLIADALQEPAQAARRAGEAWGRYLADTPAPSRRVDVDDALRRLSKVLTDAGFAPGAVEERDNPVLPLRQCPFREIAEHNQEVVCSLHLGLMRGVLAEVRAPLSAERLDPFVEPSLCLARLSPVGS